MKNEKYIEYIQIAKRIVADSDLSSITFQTVAFEVILRHLIENSNLHDIESQVESRIESYREQGRRED